jgi:NAD(P)-dependent dehydrogenase (short-subunit alcohol dehydrogenase family)
MSVPGSRFKGSRAFVTGGSKGIGRAVATRLASEGARVAIVARNQGGLDQVASEVEALGGECLTFAADASDESQISGVVDQVGARWGGLDIVVASAGIEIEEGHVHELDVSTWKHILDVNLTGQFLACKHGIKQLLRSGGGSVVCLGSNLGFLGTAAEEPSYSASKGGVFALMRVMAIDYADANIRVNMVVPGVIDTPMNEPLTRDAEARDFWVRQVPLNRMGSAEEVASAILWLSSDEASYVTGAALVVDGGMAAK